MRYKTEMMEAILQNPKAREIVDYICAYIYGESYVGLWIYEAIGTVLGEIYDIAEELKREGNAWTTEDLMAYWERHYGLPVNTSLTIGQRRKILIAKIQERGPCNPIRLANAVSAALGGVPVDITENVAKNTFLVIIREIVNSYDAIRDVLDRRKPAHLIYELRVTIQTVAEVEEIKTATATTYKESSVVEVYPIRDFPPPPTELTTAVVINQYERFFVEVTQ